MTKISDFASMVGADVVMGTDLMEMVDMSEVGAARNKKMTFAEVKEAIAPGTAAALDIDTDDTLAANSDSLIPTQQAVKAYVDANVGSVASLDDVGDVNAPTPSNGDVLTWDSTPGEWIAQAPSGGSYTSENARDDIGAALVAGLGTTITPDDGADTITVGLSTGTSFPGSPSSGDRFWRSDRNIEYFYDGTRWLSTQLFTVGIGQSDAINPRSATDAFFTGREAHPWAGLYDVYLLDGVFSTILVGTGNWSAHIVDESNNVLAQATGITSTSNVTNRVAINAVFASTQDSFNFRVTENSGTATFYCRASVTYRLVG